MRINVAGSCILATLIFLLASWGSVWGLWSFASALGRTPSYPSEALLMRGGAILESLEPKKAGPPRKGPMLLVRMGAMAITLPRAYWSAQPGRENRGRLQVRLRRIDSRNRISADVTLKCYPRDFEEPTGKWLQGWWPLASPFYHGKSHFLAAYPTVLDLFTAAAHVRPDMLHLQWGRERWRIDTLLLMRPQLLEGETVGLLGTPRLTAFVLYSRLARLGHSPARPGSFDCTAILFDGAGALAMWSVQFHVKTIDGRGSVNTVVALLSRTSVVPWSGTVRITSERAGNGR